MLYGFPARFLSPDDAPGIPPSRCPAGPQELVSPSRLYSARSGRRRLCDSCYRGWAGVERTTCQTEHMSFEELSSERSKPGRSQHRFYSSSWADGGAGRQGRYPTRAELPDVDFTAWRLLHVGVWMWDVGGLRLCFSSL